MGNTRLEKSSSSVLYFFTPLLAVKLYVNTRKTAQQAKEREREREREEKNEKLFMIQVNVCFCANKLR
jgi:hypothetical protein